jgi:hypothetical protein
MTEENPTTVDSCKILREEMLKIERALRWFILWLKESEEKLYDKWECIAQAMLSLRHMEDSRMRVWKVIQYAETGQSPL